MSETLEQEVARFKKVVANRRTTEELLALFGLLKVSEKFTNACKPACIEFLIAALCQRLPDENLKDVVAELVKTSANTFLRKAMTAERADKAVGPLIVRLLRATPMECEKMMKLFENLAHARIVKDRFHCLAMAAAGGMSESEVDPIFDLTYEATYGK